MAKYIIGITGASGSIYGIITLQELLKRGHDVYLVVTEQGVQVLEFELEMKLDELLNRLGKLEGKLIICDNKDMFAKIASGSYKVDGMMIVPCSMGTVAKISHGITDNLLVRAADVMIKEKRNLIIVPRETPLSTIHLSNLLSLSKLGVIIFPPMPAYYNRPKSMEDIIDGTIGRLLEKLGVDNNIYKVWNEEHD